ncbi:hypothetical protein AVEN_52210-1 [Araneus ventricosus]|uniref:DUF5641 domain-containing protein n=1 Tax=Araneus ventricosus TaxID=182803 RepID=A0A4Y2VNG4_ARAVE|nr:hypothetical protein AVEN_87714-1 [Araneus ventricosus]GBO40360.1 hypothetical protein AVEN_52210-1 [Araneus ventricosus]
MAPILEEHIMSYLLWIGKNSCERQTLIEFCGNSIHPRLPGGEAFWERVVRVIKELLRRCRGDSILSFEELGTVLCECESVINSCPLTYVSENSDDLFPLTPSKFLIENRNFSTGDIDLEETQSSRKRIKFKATLLKDLRLRFRKEYLSLLIQKQGRNKNVREPQIAGVVLIGDDSKKRLNWPLAIIIEVLPGRDGKVRTVKVEVRSYHKALAANLSIRVESSLKPCISGRIRHELDSSNLDGHLYRLPPLLLYYIKAHGNELWWARIIGHPYRGYLLSDLRTTQKNPNASDRPLP